MFLRGSLTVEGSAVISICIIVIGICILLAFTIYHESMDYMENVNMVDIDMPETFRQIRAGKRIFEEITG